MAQTSSTFRIQWSDKSPVSKARVSLTFVHGGTSDEDGYTNDRGQVTVKHTRTGSAYVHVKGKKLGPFDFPGSPSVTVEK